MKRNSGEGTVFQRADGRWAGATYVLTPDGGRRRKSVYGRTKTEVRDKLIALQHEVHRGVPAPDSKVTIEEYLATWLEEVVRRKVRPRTYDVYETIVRLHLVPALGRRRLSNLTPADVRRFLNAKSDAGMAPGTVKKLHVVLGSALQHAVRDDMLARNVARNVQVTVPRDEPVRPLDFDEARLLLKAAASERLYALWTVAVGIGLRRGEALGLRWPDIDLEQGTLRVEGTLQLADGRLQVTAPKTTRSRRTITLPNVCRKALRDHRRQQEAERSAAGDLWMPSDFVFTMPDGAPIQPNYVNRWLDKLCDRAGIRRIRVHDLRHTCASLLLAQGVSPRVVMEVLGHSQIGVTMNTYAHVLPVLEQQAADQMDAALSDSAAVSDPDAALDAVNRPRRHP